MLANRADLNASLNKNVEFSILQILTSNSRRMHKIKCVLHLILINSSLEIWPSNPIHLPSATVSLHGIPHSSSSRSTHAKYLWWFCRLYLLHRQLSPSQWVTLPGNPLVLFLVTPVSSSVHQAGILPTLVCNCCSQGWVERLLLLKQENGATEYSHSLLGIHSKETEKTPPSLLMGPQTSGEGR